MKPDQNTLETDRLILEPLTVAHAQATFEGWQPAELYTYIEGAEPPATLEALTTRYETLSKRVSPDGDELWLNWFARDRASGAYIVYVEISVNADSTADLGYFTFVGHWDKGYGFEACSAVMTEIRARYGVTCFCAEIDQHNFASQGLIKKLGFTKVGEAPVESLDDQDWVDFQYVLEGE